MQSNELNSINRALKMACETNFGVLDKSFLCQSLSAIGPRAPLCVVEESPLQEVLNLFQSHRIGCVLVVDGAGKLSGIFSERDFVLKVAVNFEALRHHPIAEFMTRSPMAQSMDCTLAFALNLMSHGGFRHIPIVDDDGIPIGSISVSDVIDYIVSSLTQALLNFKTS